MLRLAGFAEADISSLQAENVGTKDLAHERHTKAPEGAVAGAIPTGALGGALGWLAGAGSLFGLAFEPLLSAGPVLGLLSGLGVGGVLGGLVGGAIGFGVPEYEAKRFVGRIRRGGLLLSVHCDAEQGCARAVRILKETGARDIATARESRVSRANRPDHVPAATTLRRA